MLASAGRNPSVILKVTISLQPASPIARLWEQYPKVYIFYFQTSCTHNGDHLILSIKTDNAHKERMLSHTIINTFKKCERKGLKHSQKR